MVVQFHNYGMNPLHVQFFYHNLDNFRLLNRMLACFHMLLLLWYKSLCVVRSRKSISFSYRRVFYVRAAGVAAMSHIAMVSIQVRKQVAHNHNAYTEYGASL